MVVSYLRQLTDFILWDIDYRLKLHFLAGFNTNTTAVPHHVCCYGEKSDTQCGEGGGEDWIGGRGREGKGSLSGLLLCCVRQGQGELAAAAYSSTTLCVTMNSGIVNCDQWM